MKRQLKGKVIVITGASSGIGAATAVACAKAGMNMTLAGRNQQRLEQTAEQVIAAGGRCLPVICDVTVDEQIQELFEKSWQEFGRLDVIDANAGVGLSGSILETSEKAQRDIFEINYFGTLKTVKNGITHLRQTEDGLKHILICSSALSEIAIGNVGAYCATKAAQKSLAGAMRAEVQKENIIITSIHPVGTRTPFFQTSAVRSGRPKNSSGTTPKKLMQSPEKVAEKIVKTLRKPKPEIWPMPLARWGLACLTALPGLSAALTRRLYKKMDHQ